MRVGAKAGAQYPGAPRRPVWTPGRVETVKQMMDHGH